MRFVSRSLPFLALVACASADPALDPGIEHASIAEAVAPSVALAPTCFAPPVHDCAFYVSCLDAVHPCGATGYARGYGDKYCNRFREQTRFSEAGQRWSDAVMNCLQRRLGRFLSSDSVSCTTIKDGAFDDHPICYTQPGESICDLPPSDWRVLVGTIDGFDLITLRSLKQITAVGRTCVGGWLSFRALGEPGVEGRPLTPAEAEAQEKLEIIDELQRRIDAMESSLGAE